MTLKRPESPGRRLAGLRCASLLRSRARVRSRRGAEAGNGSRAAAQPAGLLDQQRRAAVLVAENTVFRSVLENSLDAAYQRNLLTDNYDYLSPVFEKLTGFTGEEMSGDVSHVLSRVHPADLPQLEADISAAHAEAVTHGRASATVEYRFKHREGGYIWLADHFTVLAEDGRLRHRLGIVRDVTDRKLLQAQTEREREFREALLQAVPAGIVVFSGRDLRVRWANASYREFLEEPHRSGDITGLRLDEFVPLAQEQGLLSVFRGVAETGMPHVDPEYRHEGFQRGETFWRWALLPIAAEDQEASTPDLLLVAIEVSEQVKTRRQIEQLLAAVQRSRAAAEEQSDLLRAQAMELTAASEALGVERARLATLIDQMPVGVILANAPEGELVLANRQVSEIWRHPFIRVADIQGYVAYKGFHADGTPYEGGEWPLARSLSSGEVVRDEEIVFERGDGTFGVMGVSSSPIFGRDGEIAAAVVSFIDITERKRAELAQREVATLEERQRIARELHDSVSQSLYGIALAARTALELVGRNPDRARSILEYTLNLAQSGVTEMRSLIFELRPELLATEGLIRALTKQMEALQQRREIKLDASLCSEPDMPLPAKEAFYRIAQEAVNNAVKHASARRIAVRLECSDQLVTLTITDDGVGFDPQREFPGHMGLRSMRERADAAGARLSVDSSPGSGSRITVNYPLPARGRKASARPL